MWKQLFDTAKRVVLLVEESKRNRQDIEDVQAQMRAMSMAIELLRYEIQRVSDKDANEREMMKLRLENELLRFERRLPAKRDDEN